MPAEPHDEAMMRLALDEARAAALLGEVPVGAVVWRMDADGRPEVLARAHNLRETRADPAAHAEVLALRAAAERIGTWRLDGCGLAVTLEPCPMCAGLMVNARLSRCVWGCADPKMGCAGSLHDLLREPRFNHRLEHVGGVLAGDCAAVLQDFFRARRGADKPPKPRPDRP